jgi:hypothetical protein
LDWLQLFASIVDSLAWPVIIGVAAYLLRKPLLELLPNLRHFKYKELDIQFGERLEKLEDKLEQEPPPEQLAPPSDLQLSADERFDTLVEISPSAAMLGAWINVEKTIRDLALRHNIQERRGRSMLYITRVLKSQEVISPRLAALIDDLRALRNVAAHPPVEKQISSLEARRYKEIADQVGDELDPLLG